MKLSSGLFFTNPRILRGYKLLAKKQKNHPQLITKDHYINHPHEIYLSYLKTIKDVRFTTRELDVIACIVCGRSATVSSFLSISPKTVSAHITNILQKISGNSREDIINFVEKSKQYAWVKKYYQSRVIYFDFETCLAKGLSPLKFAQLKKSGANSRSQLKESMVSARELEKHLNMVNIKASYLKKELPHTDEWFILTLSDEELENLKTKINRKILVIQKLFRIQTHENLVLVYGENSKESKTLDYVDFTECENYYLGFFELLKKVSPAIDSDQLSEKFMEMVVTLGDAAEFSNAESFLQNKVPFLSIEFLKRHYLAFLFSVCILCFGISIFIVSNADKSTYPIRSDLFIPTKSAFLDRPQITTQMENKLNEGPGIQTVAIIGTGGSGKTTLARQYARSHNASIVWEVNAETRESLVNSFKNLAYALAKTKEQKEELTFIQQIQNLEEKEQQLLTFVKSYLKKLRWVLIYDNVENFSDAKIYLSEDSEAWGRGKVILTTKNTNIQNTSYIKQNHVIQIEELSASEALQLFCKILYGKEPNMVSQEKRIKAIAFLTNIPSFPLDISIAAYYIKNTKISFDYYVERVNQSDKSFEKMQTCLLKGAIDYDKTRYEIIKLSFQRLMETDAEFKELLWFICLLDSQSIPRSLLESYKDPLVVENFIHELKKYSLITSESLEKDKDKISTFSLHRSTQTLGRAYLADLLNAAEKKALLFKLITMIQSFYEAHVEKNHSIIRASIPHLQTLLKILQTLDLSKELKDLYTQDLLCVLGYAHMKCLRNLILEKQYFSEAYRLQKETQHYPAKKLAHLLKDLASTCVDLEHADEAALYAQASLKTLKDIPQSELLIAENLRLLGYAYTYKNDFEQAQLYLNEALKEVAHVDAAARKESESSIYSQLAWLYSVTYITGDNVTDAKKYIHKALEIMDGDHLFYNQTIPPQKIVSPYIYIARHRTTLGDIYCRSGDYKEAVTQGFREAHYIIDHAFNRHPDHLLNIYIAIGMGEVYLRENRLQMAKNTLIDVMRETERMAGKNNSLTLSPKIFLIETKIRLGELDEAYEDCLSALKIERKVNTNYANLMYFLGHYHAAVIQYKLGDLKKSLGHFSDFLREMKVFCSSFLDKKIYDQLEEQKTFDVPENLTNTTLHLCLQKCKVILTSIYGESHPFIKDFVLKMKW